MNRFLVVFMCKNPAFVGFFFLYVCGHDQTRNFSDVESRRTSGRPDCGRRPHAFTDAARPPPQGVGRHNRGRQPRCHHGIYSPTVPGHRANGDVCRCRHGRRAPSHSGPCGRLAEAIYKGRTLRHWGQVDVSAASGVSRVSVHNVEKGRTIAWSTIERVCEALGLEPVCVVE
jgi:DNA-binding Xre family transcriptional regulator